MPDDISKRLADALRSAITVLEQAARMPYGPDENCTEIREARETLAAFDALSAPVHKAKCSSEYSAACDCGAVAQPPAAFDEGELWSFLRRILDQGTSIQQDYAAGKYPSYEHLQARLDEAARERADQWLAARRQSGQGGG